VAQGLTKPLYLAVSVVAALIIVVASWLMQPSEADRAQENREFSAERKRALEKRENGFPIPSRAIDLAQKPIQKSLVEKARNCAQPPKDVYLVARMYEFLWDEDPNYEAVDEAEIDLVRKFAAQNDMAFEDLDEVSKRVTGDEDCWAARTVVGWTLNVDSEVVGSP